jgi:NAD(P)-dependent dehydrogenase (short-subunit alcohol dehydrogenase family)
MNSAKLALVTGANQGIGLETCRQLKAAGWQVVLTSRDEKAGHAAARDLGVDYHQLDVTSADSIATLVTDLGRERRRIDLLVNNAGISMQGFDTEVVRETLAVNFFGALHVTEALLPLIADGGAIVMVSSGMGELHAYAPAIRARFADPSLSRDQLVALVEEFAVAVAAGDHAAKGWPSSAYRVSKAAIVRYWRAILRPDASASTPSARAGYAHVWAAVRHRANWSKARAPWSRLHSTRAPTAGSSATARLSTGNGATPDQ